MLRAAVATGAVAALAFGLVGGTHGATDPGTAALTPATAAANGTATVSAAVSAAAYHRARAPKPKPVPKTLFGMQPTGLTGTAVSAAQLAGASPRSGVGTVKLVSSGAEWRTVEATKGTHNFDPLDRAVANARAAGARDIDVLIGGTPLWAAKRVLSTDRIPGYGSTPKRFGDYKRFVTALAKRYKGRISSYQVWAEANLRDLWSGTPNELAKLTAIAYKAIKSQDPGAEVLAASTTARWACCGWYTSYLNKLAKKKYRYKGHYPADVLSAHLYAASTGSPLDRQRLLGTVKAAIARSKAPKLPLWDSEINYGVAGPGPTYPHVNLDNAKGAGYVARTYLDALRFGVDRVYWSAWMPKNPVYGITMWPGSKGAVAQQVTYDWLVGNAWRGCTTSRQVVTCVVGTGKRTATIAWSEGKKGKVIAPKKSAVLCQLNGKCVKTKAGKKIKVNGTPVRIGRR
ncbi:MAG TPA: hypothetical protein VFN19_00450 [Candidatus Nanopelagicales bacterium]|nr:hypothetical protein [Candidatus Nanopelagicales bacterium]